MVFQPMTKAEFEEKYAEGVEVAVVREGVSGGEVTVTVWEALSDERLAVWNDGAVVVGREENDILFAKTSP
jgi:hypothetical protein